MAKTYRDLDVYNIFGPLANSTVSSSLPLETPPIAQGQLPQGGLRACPAYGKSFLRRASVSGDVLQFLSKNPKIELLYPALSTEANELRSEYNNLGGKLNKFIDYVTNNWKT